jgi:DNA polymerase I-like protein with 3'-5' exonuclease and polymerase domains
MPCWMLWSLAPCEVLWPVLVAEPKLLAYYKEIEKPIVPVVAMMEDVGVRVDPAMLQQLDLQLTKLIDEYEEIAQLALEVDETFKINSPEQLAARLGKLGIRLSKETASGNKSVDKNSLLKALDAMNLDDIDEEEIAQDQAKTALMSCSGTASSRS